MNRYVVPSNPLISIDDDHNFYNTHRGNKLKPSITVAGYLAVSCQHNGIRKASLAHRLIAEVFIPNPENLPEVNHKDGVKTNNSLENLEWVTKSENMLHSCRTLGKRLKSEKVWSAVLKPEQVHEICRRLEQGARNIDLAKDFGVSAREIATIRHKLTWREITEQYDLKRARPKNLAENTVRWICSMLDKGYKAHQIKKMSTNPKITVGIIQHIKKGHTFTHISKDYDFLKEQRPSKHNPKG